MIRYYKGGVDPWSMTMVQWNVMLEAIVDIGQMESGKVDTESSAKRLRRNAHKMRKLDQAKAALNG